MRAYGYWVEGPATVTGGIALERMRTSFQAATRSHSFREPGGYAYTSSSTGFTAVTYHDRLGVGTEITQIPPGDPLSTVTDATAGTWATTKTESMERCWHADGTDQWWDSDAREWLSWSTTMDSYTTVVSRVSCRSFEITRSAGVFGADTYRTTVSSTWGEISTAELDMTQSLATTGAGDICGVETTSWTTAEENPSSTHAGTVRQTAYVGINVEVVTGRWTNAPTVSVRGTSSRSGTGRYLWYDEGPTQTEETFNGATTTGTVVTATVASFSAGSTTTATQTWEAKTSTTADLTRLVKTTTTTKKWGGADVAKFLAGQMVFHGVYEVDASDCLVTKYGSKSGFWPPGTTTRTPKTLGLAGGDYCSVTTESSYFGDPSCGITTAGGAYYGYATYTSTLTSTGDTTFDRATADGTDQPPLDGIVGVSLPSGGSATTTFTVYASSGPTYTYSYSGYGDKRSTMESAFTTSNGWLFLSMDNGGGTAWALSSYTYSYSPYTMLITGGQSDSYSWSQTSLSTWALWGVTSSQYRTTTSSSSSSSVGIGTTAWGQRFQSSIEEYTTYSADSYWTYTHDKTARNMLGFSLQCSDGFRGDRAQGVFSNLTADEYPPTLRDGQLYSTQACGGRVPAFHGSGVVTLNGASYSTTHLSENSYLVSSSDWAAARTCVWNAAGDAKTYVSWKDYVDYAETNPPTIIGDGEDRTVSMMLQDWSWYSRMALAYTSVNTSVGGTTRGTTEYSPWYLTRDTTLSVGSQCQVAFRIFPYALSSSGTQARLVSTTALFNLDGSSTMDLWKY